METEKSVAARKKVAIITGASSGLGREFALQIEKGHFLDEIWLIARRLDRMQELSERFQKTKAVMIPCDLNSQGDMLALEKKLQRENPDICYLVNNAGFGKIGPFAELGREEQLHMIDLNIRALTQLTHMALPYMLPGAAIFQVASSIAFHPAPNFAVYAATKSYVLSFSQALQFELKEKGIHVIAVCPGPVNTEFFGVAQKNNYTKTRVPPAEPSNKAFMVEAKHVVAKALADAKARRTLSVYSIPVKIFASLIRFVPQRLSMRAMSKRL